jgi:hypothetical protein
MIPITKENENENENINIIKNTKKNLKNDTVKMLQAKNKAQIVRKV